jgi:ketosteroid isomerase-like protein
MTTLLSAGLLTAEHLIAVRVKRAEIAAGQGDISALQAVHAETMVVHNSPLRGDAVGRQALYDQNKIMFQNAGGTLRLVPYHVVANDESVLVVARVTGQRAGKVLDQVVLEIWRMSDGKCVEVRDHFSDQPAWDHFWQ